MDSIDTKEKDPDDLKLYLKNQTDYYVKVAEDIIEYNNSIIHKIPIM